jgi:hypothetical protein
MGQKRLQEAVRLADGVRTIVGFSSTLNDRLDHPLGPQMSPVANARLLAALAILNEQQHLPSPVDTPRTQKYPSTSLR